MTAGTGYVRVRTETGVMRVGDDWPGIFLRGDDALHMAEGLRLIAAAYNLPADQGSLINGWIETLNACKVESRE